MPQGRSLRGSAPDPPGPAAHETTGMREDVVLGVATVVTAGDLDDAVAARGARAVLRAPECVEREIPRHGRLGARARAPNEQSLRLPAQRVTERRQARVDPRAFRLEHALADRPDPGLLLGVAGIAMKRRAGESADVARLGEDLKRI